jgi:hypothetical protein
MHIVVWDPDGEWWEGALVPEPEQARALAQRRVCLLPVVPQLLQASADAGYFRRAWGKGVALPTGGHGPLCPLSLYAVHDMHYIHWAARLTPTADIERMPDDSLRLVGMLRLVPDGMQRGGFQAQLEGAERDKVDFSLLGPPDEQGGWTVGGTARIRQAIDAKACVSLHGSAMGARPQLRVVWAAITQTANPEG